MVSIGFYINLTKNIKARQNKNPKCLMKLNPKDINECPTRWKPRYYYDEQNGCTLCKYAFSCHLKMEK